MQRSLLKNPLSSTRGNLQRLRNDWMSLPEIWGGVECTIARIGDAWRNQLSETGHDRRLDDLNKIHELGLRTLRYPVLWEMVSPRDPEEADWSWTDERLTHLRSL